MRTSTILLLTFIVLPLCRADTFVHRKTGETVTGRFLGSVFKDGKQQFYVKTDDGKNRLLSQDEWERKAEDKGQDPPPSGRSDSGETNQPRNVLDVDFGLGAGKGKATPQVMQVVATGVGADPEAAKQNAFSNAIEQTVGVLVDSETLVKNDELIHEQVLTVSRGYIERFDVLKEWQADGLHRARIQAVVSVSRLVEQLTAHHIAVKGVSGEQLSRQARFEVKNERHAGELFAKIMDDYSIDKLFKVEIVGKPEVVEKNDVEAKLKVQVRLSPDWEQWSKIRAQLDPLLRTIATKESAFVSGQDNPRMDEVRWVALDREVAKDLPNRLKGQGPAIAMLRKINRNGSKAAWGIFRVPDSMGDFTGLMDAIKARRHEVRVVLLDADKTPLAEERLPMQSRHVSNDAAILGYHSACDRNHLFGVDAYWLGPLLWHKDDTRHRFVYPCEVTVRVVLDRLGQVTQCAAYASEAEPRR